MRRALLLASIGVLVFSVVASTGACGDDGSPAAQPEASTDEEAGTVCDTFNGTGKPCAPISDLRCFPLCATGGCMCSADPANPGKGIWTCTDDTSCIPEAGPVDFDATDDSGDQGDDAGNTSDATMSDGASTDATSDGASTDASDSGITDAADSG